MKSKMKAKGMRAGGKATKVIVSEAAKKGKKKILPTKDHEHTREQKK